MTQEKAEEASRLLQDITDLEVDIEEVKKKQYIRFNLQPVSFSCRNKDIEYAEKVLQEFSEAVNNHIQQGMEGELKALQDKLDSL